ncbi:hypothetical protein PAXRUDRAFT_823158 [Paxillus rubicundulus Ve08.2h10]|uniref:C2H2-type domain-containing protein n=1 Tax=Paxillus rubicundulus Ve08.2h10 TaxID=930991 RepID=A0A0D0DKN8_9AGAM|nr:hypothetical protein PAXRUDRAFT_823158 [Paxillus rubicundulus Ve08.2h10]
MSDHITHREEARRPTLPPVRDLFRDELSRSPRPPTDSSLPWIVSGARTDQDYYRSPSRAERCADGQLYGPGVQRSPFSASYYPSPASHQRHDGRVASHSFFSNTVDNLPTTQYHSQPRHQHHARSTSEAVQRRPSHDHTIAPGPLPHFSPGLQPHPGSYPVVGASSRSTHYGVPGPYPDIQHRAPMTSSSSSEVAHQTPVPSPPTSKYECDYCGKGFTRPSSLKIHLNSHTGEKPFVCTFEGCGRSFSVLSNMRRHARVHTEVAGRHQEGSSDEQ